MTGVSRRDATKALAATVLVGSAGVSLADHPADPIFAAIHEAETAWSEWKTVQARIHALEATIPDDLLVWRGVFLGMDGVYPAFSRDEADIRRWFALAKTDGAGEPRPLHELSVIERHEDHAVKELHSVVAARREAWRKAGLPYVPGAAGDGETDADEYIEPYLQRINNADASVYQTRPTTLDGLFAKMRHVAAVTLRDSLHETIEEMREQCGDFDPEYLVMVLADDAATILKGGAA